MVRNKPEPWKGGGGGLSMPLINAKWYAEPYGLPSIKLISILRLLFPYHTRNAIITFVMRKHVVQFMFKFCCSKVCFVSEICVIT